MFKLPQLPYCYDALEPYIDAKTMEIHYTGHHQAYVNNLNAALQNYPELQNLSLEDLIKNLDKLPEKIRNEVRNNGGGHLNHSMFWTMMTKNSSLEPIGQLETEIKKIWGTFEAFKEEFSNTAKKVFGSGWAWLTFDKSGKLIITSTPNQDTPIFQDSQPILGLDVWEHAYYLKYQNKRVDYIQAWWNVINWKQIEENYRKYT